MPANTSDQVIVAAWEADGRPVPYPDYKASYLANNGQWQPVSGHSTAAAPVNNTPYSPGTLADLFVPIAMSGNDGSKEYYDRQTAYIDKQLDDPSVTPQKKQELRAQKDQLDQEFLPQRQDAATKTLQGAKTDEEALAALQALEGLRGTASGGQQPQQPAGQYINGKLVDPSLAKNGPVYDPENEAQMREEWEQDFKPKGVSFEEYKQMVKAANPDGALRYTSPTAKNIGRGGSAKTFPGLTDPSAGGGGNGANSQQILNNASITQAGSLGYFDNVSSRAIADLGSKNKETDEAAKQTLAKLAESGQLTKQQTTAISQKLSQAADDTNASSRASTQRLTQAVNTANSGNTGALNSYVSGIKPYQNEIGGTSRQNVQFDPEGLAAQRASLAQAQAIAGGSLDYQSQAAQAYANPDDIARALEGIGMLRENALTGGKNQQEVLNRYRDISTPEMTAAERAILAQSQRQFAIHDKANRDAVSRDLQARGVMSGAGQIAQQQSSQQQLGEERVAGTLGAQAQAVQRALIGLQGMESSSNALRSGDLAAQGAYTSASQTQRKQGFDEEYARGVGADNASANNQSTRLGGAGIQANQANAIRSANDQVNMFNNEQQGITDRYNTSFKQSEYERLTGLQQQTFNNTIGVNQTNLGNEFGLDQSTQGALEGQFGRTNTAAQTGIGVAMGNWGIDQTQAGMDRQAQEASRAAQQQQTSTKIDTAGKRTDLSRTTNKEVEDALRGLNPTYRI
jgi:hypothetical protein